MKYKNYQIGKVIEVEELKVGNNLKKCKVVFDENSDQD